jgi:AcrR family transcriptional regulator
MVRGEHRPLFVTGRRGYRNGIRPFYKLTNFVILSTLLEAGDRKLPEVLELAADNKRARIMGAALSLALAHGYSRTTMDDIARAAEMSRPALYLVFRNKLEIYREIAKTVMRGSIEAARGAIGGEGSFTGRLGSAIDAAIFSSLCRFSESPHGGELLDMKASLAGDLIENWRSELSALFAGAIRAEADANGVDLEAEGLCPHGMANMLMDGLEGMKTRLADIDAQKKAACGLVRVIALALRA